MEIVKLLIKDLEVNSGQIEGLPTNPRQWSKDDVMKLANSLIQTPELFDMRPCIVYPFGKKYIILGGNMRYQASKQNLATEIPCIVVPKETNIEKLKEIVIKDNGSFGNWDYDELANRWDDLPLTEWGVPVWETKEVREVTGIKEHKDKSDEVIPLFQIAIDCESEEEQERVYNELKDKYRCRVLTL
jgi:hypothetical protein